jgi:hypothetical protein
MPPDALPHSPPPQAQHDYLAGNYPVVREDAAQMAALQMQVRPTMQRAFRASAAAPYLRALLRPAPLPPRADDDAIPLRPATPSRRRSTAPRWGPTPTR